MSNQTYNFKDTNFLVKSSAIAAIYAVITLIYPALAYGPIQLRFSEILVLLVFYNKRFILGLVLGCFLANLASDMVVFDLIFGTLASYLAFSLIRKQNNLFIASLFPVLFMFIPAIGTYILLDSSTAFFIILIQFMISEFIVVSIIGVIIFKILEKNEGLMKIIKNF
ncbi:QueT transporter family protein [Anaerococcus sp. AGMB00486]|uniref:QueT transporter family protein n=1 Tax=Anaerococcus faecalis TaxID=2742993 RepID=A0ABX2N6W2_9FIRM|nr:QueT transporter family protein [Anaerococcus faecalis]NVF10427.1 QueT transporter family protein [Anaerococcus faecalis]